MRAFLLAFALAACGEKEDSPPQDSIPQDSEPAVEDCEDGVDNDGDGLTDCADEDCTGLPACVEDCEDGVDNDLDGLLDCEDGECADSPACVEDCSDEVDNDGDTLADCEDPDCTAELGCAVITAQVIAGSMQTRRLSQSSFYILYGGTYASRSTVSNQASVELRDVSGRFVLNPSGSALSCGWSLSKATWTGSTYGRGDAQVQLLNRSGFQTFGDCGLSSAMLPTSLTLPVGSSQAWVAGTGGLVWYQGAVTASSYRQLGAHYSSSYGPYGSAFISTVRSYARSAYVPTMSSGSVYVVP